jgi:DOPA 4,5-dioxygenase
MMDAAPSARRAKPQEERDESAKRIVSAYGDGFIPAFPPADQGKSPWGYETIHEATPRPKGLRPGEENGLPKAPRPFTDIKGYHAHFYFGFTNDLLPIVIPWLQLNSLGLTILVHPNTDDPRGRTGIYG